MPDQTNQPVENTEATREPGDQFEAASRSLGDALAVSFRVLRWLFVVLLIVFLFSGVFTVQQNQVAVRTSFGRITTGPGGSEVLTADGGPYFRWPRPIGEVYFIPTTVRTLRLDDSFVFNVAPRDQGRPLAELTSFGGLNPAEDGALLTGDKNIVHARYDVLYRVRPESAADFVRNVAGPVSAENFSQIADQEALLFQQADRLVRMAVEEAIVAEVATRDIDEFLSNARAAAPTPTAPDAAEEATPAPAEGAADEAADGAATPEGEQAPTDATAEGATDPAGTPANVAEDRVRAAAQATLDSLNAGITLEDVIRKDFTVPPTVRGAFELLSSNLQAQRQMVSQGQAERTRILTGAAGSAYQAVLAVIDAYEAADRQVETDPTSEEAQAALEAADTAMRNLLLGEPVGQVLPTLAETLPQDDPRRDRLLELARRTPNATVSGVAYTSVRDAETQATDLVKQTETELERFNRLLPDYRRAPELIKRQLFFAAMRDIFSQPDVSIDLLRGEGVVTIQAGQDPQRQQQDEEAALRARGANGRQ